MAEFYVTQERAMAPGIAGDWPKVIAKPDNPNGRLVKVEGLENLLGEAKQFMVDAAATGKIDTTYSSSLADRIRLVVEGF